MNPLIATELVELRHEELRREAQAERRVRVQTAGWEHPWRRGLGRQLEHWGQRLQGPSAPDRSLSLSR